VELFYYWLLVDILLMDIGDYFKLSYHKFWWLSMNIGGYFISGYYWVFYCRLSVIIIFGGY